MGQWHAHVVRPKFATSVFRIGKQGTLSGFIATDVTNVTSVMKLL